MDVYNFVVSEGMLIDAPRYARTLKDLGVSQADLQALRIRISQVQGTRRGVLEVRGGVPSLSLRPLAPAPSEITVDATPILDERDAPGRYGPDVGWQQAQLAKLQAREGLLVDASGRVISALLHPILVVEPGRVRVSAHPASHDSVALDCVLDILRGHGVGVVEEPAGFDHFELLSQEVWVISPVYGASLVDTWIEYGTKRPARLLFDRGGVPSHREVNEERRALAARV